MVGNLAAKEIEDMIHHWGVWSKFEFGLKIGIEMVIYLDCSVVFTSYVGFINSYFWLRVMSKFYTTLNTQTLKNTSK